MALLPVILILVSCFSHAGWNLLARHRRRESVFMRRMLICVSPLAAGLIGGALLMPHSFPARTWLYVVPSGIVGALYFRFLALAYGSSDFTIVYPVGRALPVLVVAGIDVLRGRYPSQLGWVGMVVVVAGCVLAPQESLRDFDLRRYHLREVAWILLTAAAIVGFTMLDKLAQEIVRQGPGSAALYCGIWHLCASLTYLVLDRPGGARGRDGDRIGWALPAAGAVLGLISYTLVLWAFQLWPQAGYLLALRQFSIVIGVVAAFIIHREAGAAVRLPATAAIVTGLALLVLFG